MRDMFVALSLYHRIQDPLEMEAKHYEYVAWSFSDGATASSLPPQTELEER